jgi:hypothetical protein
MANTISPYNPIFYAQEGLIQLEKALGMASRVHRGYDRERRTFNRGETIQIKKPGTFTVNDAPATAEDLSPESVTITLANWKEVKFKLSDKELAFTGEEIINDHIRPAAYALADNIDQALVALYYKIPWYYTLNAAPGSVVTDITQPRKILFDNAVPLDDNVHFMVDGEMEANLLGNSAFSQWQGAGQAGVDAQLRGTLGRRFGMEIFANQNTTTHTGGDFTDESGTVVGAHSVGATTLAVTALDFSSTVKKGDTLSIAGDTQRYAVTADTATDGSGAATLPIYPTLKVGLSGSEVVTVETGTGETVDLAFHRNAFCFVSAMLPETGNELGANIASVQDPITGLSLRSRMYYVGNSSEVHVALDILYGVDVLDGNLACRAMD